MIKNEMSDPAGYSRSAFGLVVLLRCFSVQCLEGSTIFVAFSILWGKKKHMLLSNLQLCYCSFETDGRALRTLTA